MGDERADQDQRSHPPRDADTGLVDFIDEQIVTAAGRLAVEVIKQADGEARDGQQIEQPRLGKTQERHRIERPQEKRGRRTDGDGQGHEDRQPFRGGKELGGGRFHRTAGIWQMDRE